MIETNIQEGNGDCQVEGNNGECPMGKSKRKLSDKQILIQSITFLLAGYETAANTLTYTAYLLALHPEVQEKLQREIDTYMEENPVQLSSLSLSLSLLYSTLLCLLSLVCVQDASLFEVTEKIGYLDMVLQESLRMYTPIS